MFPAKLFSPEADGIRKKTEIEKYVVMAITQRKKKAAVRALAGCRFSSLRTDNHHCFFQFQTLIIVNLQKNIIKVVVEEDDTLIDNVI